MENPQIVVYQAGQGEIVEKKSRFIANIFPVQSEEEAQERIAEVKKEHYDARHNCFAYVLGEKNETERCSDDGEPSGTAGRPMLEVLTGRGIHNAVAIVTRYFGGTLLGTGGLVRAYTAAVKEGIAHCVLMEQNLGYKVSVKTDYNDIGKIQYMARMSGWSELDTVYADAVESVLLLPREKWDGAKKEITEKTAGRARAEILSEVRYGVMDGQIYLLGKEETV